MEVAGGGFLGFLRGLKSLRCLFLFFYKKNLGTGCVGVWAEKLGWLGLGWLGWDWLWYGWREGVYIIYR